MTERQGQVRPMPPPATGLVSHKAARECTIEQPHAPELCGVVRARERRQVEGDEVVRRLQSTDELRTAIEGGRS